MIYKIRFTLLTLRQTESRLNPRLCYFCIKGVAGIIVNTEVYVPQLSDHIEEITLEDTKAALKEANRVQTQRDPARQKKKQGFALFFCYENCHGKGFE